MILWEAIMSLNSWRDKPFHEFSPASWMLMFMLWVLLQLLLPLLFVVVVVLFVELLLLLMLLLIVVVILSWDLEFVLLLLFMLLLLLFKIACDDLISLTLFNSSSALWFFCCFSARLNSWSWCWPPDTCNWISLPLIRVFHLSLSQACQSLVLLLDLTFRIFFINEYPFLL